MMHLGFKLPLVVLSMLMIQIGNAQNSNSSSVESQTLFRIPENYVILSIAILIFALILCLMMVYVVTRTSMQWDSMSIIRIFGLTFVITTAMYLITAGYSTEQISPMIGLLGSIAGYLLGEAKRDGPKD
jgi:Trk-type K+ transport system membrane component